MNKHTYNCTLYDTCNGILLQPILNINPSNILFTTSVKDRWVSNYCGGGGKADGFQRIVGAREERGVMYVIFQFNIEENLLYL